MHTHPFLHEHMQQSGPMQSHSSHALPTLPGRIFFPLVSRCSMVHKEVHKRLVNAMVAILCEKQWDV